MLFDSQQILHQTIMSKITGSFYFKRTDTGNLIGEYLNNHIQESRPESALRDSKDKGTSFPGVYISTWFEPDNLPAQGDPVVMNLKIEATPSSPCHFSLAWTPPGEFTPHYEGQAMFCDGMLVGHYWS